MIKTRSTVHRSHPEHLTLLMLALILNCIQCHHWIETPPPHGRLVSGHMEGGGPPSSGPVCSDGILDTYECGCSLTICSYLWTNSIASWRRRGCSNMWSKEWRRFRGPDRARTVTLVGSGDL
jgi:hypothetical protein